MKKIKSRILFFCLFITLFVSPSPKAQAYESGIHYYLTYVLGHWCGLHSDIDTIALADYSVDRFPQTDAGSHFNEWADPTKMQTRRIFHFAVPNGSNQKVQRGSLSAWETVQFAVKQANPNNVNSVLLGIGLHTLQDSYSHEGFGPRFGHWTQAPDLPENDPAKMVQAAEATWIALDQWSTAVYGSGCKTAFKDVADELQSWAELSLNSDFELTQAWRGMILKITQKDVSPVGLYQETSFSNRFLTAAALTRQLKRNP